MDFGSIPTGIVTAAFSRDGTRVVTAGEDGTARVWEVAMARLLASTAPSQGREDVNSAAFSSDGRRIVTASGDGTARVWDVAPDPRPADDLRRLAELLSSRRVDDAGGVPSLSDEEWQALWEELSRKYATNSGPPAAPRRSRRPPTRP